MIVGSSLDSLRPNNISQSSIDLSVISEREINLRLTQYFLVSSSKGIPYEASFTAHPSSQLNCLKHLYPFTRANNNSYRVRRIFLNIMKEQMQMLASSEKTNAKQTALDSLLNSSDRKLLISRYISLPTLLAKDLLAQQTNINTLNRALTINLVSRLVQLEREEVVFLLNKVILQGHS